MAAGAERQSGVQHELDAPVLLRLLPFRHDEQPLADLHGLVELLPVVLPVRVFNIFHAEDQRRVLGMLLFEGRQTDTELREGVVALRAVLQVERDAALAVHLLHQLVVDIVPVLVVIFEEVLEVGSVEKQYEKYLGFQQKFDEHLWGVSTGPDYNPDHIEMTIHFGPGEEFILHRLDREKRHGRIELLDDQTCRFIADVYDASEMLPWIRTFIGRIVDLQCSNKFVVKTFNDDLRHMEAIYGGETDAV